MREEREGGRKRERGGEREHFDAKQNETKLPAERLNKGEKGPSHLMQPTFLFSKDFYV